MLRFRIHYCKGEELQYIGNLDLHRSWEHTFRRAKIPLAYSQGFHPQPRMHQACPLPLGFTSEVELLDFWVDMDENPLDLKEKLIEKAQPGIKILSLTEIPLKSPPLQTVVDSVSYKVYLDKDHNIEAVREKVDGLINSKSCLRERRGKSYDLRSLLHELTLRTDFNPPELTMRLSALPGATGRPEEVLDELGISPLSVEVVRTEMNLIPVQKTE
jgi:radical SAM-linked protein